MPEKTWSKSKILDGLRCYGALLKKDGMKPCYAVDECLKKLDLITTISFGQPQTMNTVLLELHKGVIPVNFRLKLGGKYQIVDPEKHFKIIFAKRLSRMARKIRSYKPAFVKPLRELYEKQKHNGPDPLPALRPELPFPGKIMHVPTARKLVRKVTTTIEEFFE